MAWGRELGSEEHARVGVRRAREDQLRFTTLNNPAAIHDHHLVGKRTHRVEIVSYEESSQACAQLQIAD
jgi:hypothetical protein